LFVVETGSHYVAQADFKLEILLPQFLEYWDYRRALPYVAGIWVFNILLRGSVYGLVATIALSHGW
jgi:hypothetical protein